MRYDSFPSEGGDGGGHRPGGSGGKIAAIIIVAVIVLAVFGFVIAKNEEEQRSRNLVKLITIMQSSDSDGDGIPNVTDPFPKGDPEPTSYQLRLQINNIGVKDYVDVGDEYAEVYLQAYVDGVYIGMIDNAGSPWSCKVGSIYWVSAFIMHQIERTHGMVNIKLVMMDEDVASDDILDINGLSSSSRALDLSYDLDTGMIMNAKIYGQADGSLDGTSMTDDDDGVIAYEVTAWPEYVY